MPKIDRKKILRKDKIVLKNQRSERIRKIIFPHDIDFGIDDIPGIGKNIKFINGLSGSLTHLKDGTSYLVAGAGIDITTGSNGSIIIEASGGSGAGDIQGVTAGTGLSGGGTSGTVTLNLDIAGLSTSLDDSTVSAFDLLAIADVNDSNNVKKITIEQISEKISGDGLDEVLGVLNVDINGLTAAEINVAEDFIAFSDEGSSNDPTRKESIADFITAVAGTGLSDSTGVLNVDLNEVGDATVDVANDSIVIIDANASNATKKESIAHFVSGIAGTGLSESSGQLVVGSLTVAQGGTGRTSFADKSVIITQDSGSPDLLSAVAMSTNGQLLIGGTSGPAAATLAEGTNISITNADGAITIAASGVAPGAAGSNTQVQFNDGGSALGGDSGLVYNKTTNTLTSTNISGSLTTLANGTSYLISSGSTTITTGSNGAITISSIDTRYGAGDGLDLVDSGTTFALDLKSNGGLEIDITELAIDNGIVATISGSTFTGATLHNAGLSGSLTKLTNGNSYLVAGNNVTITSGATGQITISAAGGSSGTPGGLDTQIQFNDGSSFGGDAGLTYNKTTDALTATNITGSLTRLSNGSTYLVAGPNISITSQSNGSILITGSASSAAGSSTIGTPEDGSYEDGLFSDFTSSTEIGTAIDRFNEVLKSLAPSPAPNLDDIDSKETGTGVFLSFGSSNDQSSATPAYISVAASAGIQSAVDVNGSYTVATGSNNIRLGAFNGDTHISGTLNADIDSNSQGNNVQNFPAFSFGNGDTGVLRLNVNGTTIKEIDFTTALIGSGTSGIGTGSHLDLNGSGFNFFSTATTGTFSNGNEFASFKHRTGQYVISSGSQRLGWNYARVLHVKSGSTLTTNYVEWVNDDNSDALSAVGNSISFEGSGSVYLSGVKYFKSGSATYKTRVTNAYKYVYDNTNITFTTTNTAADSSSPVFAISAQSKPTIDGSENHTKVLHITGSGVVTANYFLSGAVTASINVTHPFKPNLSSTTPSIASGILMYNLSNTSTALSETFRKEDYRIISGAYSTQNALTASENIWDSTKHITASNGGHSNGLQFYNTRLYSPVNTLRSGDFRDVSDGGLLDNAPSVNPDYSGQSGQRTFYRWFKNETGSTKHDLSLAINGSGTIVSAATALNSSRIRVFVKFPSNGTRETGWLDLATEFILDAYADNAGAHTANGGLSFDSSLNATNYITLGTVGIANNDYIGLRIEAHTDWTGYIDSATVVFGAGTGTITAIPDLDDIDCNDDGTDCNLSFGTSKVITGYTTVAASAGLGEAVDVNGLYETDNNSNNLRRSVFALDTIIEGDLNEDVSANSPDYVANSFSDANSGSLVLEVNGTDIHTVEITGSYDLVGAGEPGSGSDTSFTNDSGFFDLSVWRPAEFDNEIPYYLEIYRTGKYRVHTGHQRNGWNYARIKHIGSWGTRTTNYVEWVNDNNANSLSAASVGIQSFKDDEIFHLSGVKYFVQPSGSLEARISNLYKNVYSDSSSAISFANLTNGTGIAIIQSGSGLSSTKTTAAATDSLQTLNLTTDSEQQDAHMSGSIRFSRSKSLSGSFTTKYNCAGSLVFDHPLKSNLTTNVATANVLHVYSSSDNSLIDTSENFSGEFYRLQSGSYEAQADATSDSYNWSSTGSLNDNGNFPGYYTGLMLYDGYLVSPFSGGNKGDFRNHTEGGSIEGPASNVNYSTLGTATREYYRAFINPTSSDTANILVSMTGSNANIIGKGGALNTNTVNVELKIPGKTGFLDLGHPSSGSGNILDGNGCLSGDPDFSIDGSGNKNVCTFNGQTVGGTASTQEYIVLKISADKSWVGYISEININWSTL